MSKESNLELKVGAFVLLAFIIFVVFIFSISDFSSFQKGKTVKVIFGFANGLKKSAPVRLAGVDVGSVRDLQIFFDRNDRKTKVKVDLWLKEDTQIPVDSQVWINQLGLLGEKYVEIMPGTDTNRFVENSGTLVGQDPIAMEQLSARMNQLTSKLENTVEGVNAIIRSDKNQKSIEETLLGLSEIINNIKQGRGTVGRLLYDESIFNDLEGFTADLKANPWKLLYKPRSK